MNLDFVKLAIKKSAVNILQSVDRVGSHEAGIPCPGIGNLNAKIYKKDSIAVVDIHSVDDNPINESILISIDRNGFVSVMGEEVSETISDNEEDNEEDKEPEPDKPDKPIKVKKKRKIKPKEKESLVEVNGIKWELVEPGEVEELKQRKGDEKVYGAVNTQIYCYKMTCPRCSSERFCKPQDIRQVTLCRACTIDDRKMRHANRQRARRKNKQKVVNGK